MEEEKVAEESVEYAVEDKGSTVCEHDLVPAEQDPNSNLASAQCTKCAHGASYDPDQFEIQEGKLIKKGE